MSEQLWLGLATLVVIAIGILVSKKFSVTLSKKGLNVSSSQQQDKDQTYQKRQ